MTDEKPSHQPDSARSDIARDEVALALYTGLEAIIDHARQLAERGELDGVVRGQIEAIRTLGRRALELTQSLTTVGASSDDASPDPLVGTETILLVEDQASVRSLIAEALRRRGYQVIGAENGEDAIERAGAYAAPIHLVVTDVIMPQMSGRELFDQLRQWYPKLRVLFMSGYAAGAVSALLLEDGRTGFIAKPFLMNALVRAMRDLLDGS